MVAGEIGKIPCHRRIGPPDRFRAVDESDIVELGAAHPLRLQDPEQTGVVQIPLGLRWQTPQLLGPRGALAQLGDQRFGPADHGGVGALIHLWPGRHARVRLPTGICHLSPLAIARLRS